jgi:hypothetical protein
MWTLLALALAADLHAQGMAARGVSALPRPKASGRIFAAQLTDTAVASGLDRPVVSGGLKSRYIVEAIGTGVGFIDYDNDGWLDVFLVGGSQFDGLPGSGNSLYRNNRNRTFTPVAGSGLTKTGWGQSVTAADYDNDGFTDLFVTYWGQDVLFRNTGKGSFHDATAEAGLQAPGQRWGSGASFFDFDRDGDVDLFIANYLTLDIKAVPLPGASPSCVWLGVPVFCGPRGLPYSTNRLYRNDAGKFVDVSDASGIGTPTRTYPLGVLAADMDGDSWPDLYIACDSTRSLFYHNNKDGTFSERGVYLGLAYDETGMEQAGMGAALGDYDGDGLLDIVKTNFADDYPNLYRNGGNSGYTDRALHAGLGVNPQYVLWGAIFADFDNDARSDLLFTAGHVFSEVDALRTPQRYRNPRLLYWNLGGGKFEDVTESAGPGISARHCSRGAAVGDFDNDGDPDVLVMNRNEPPSLLENRLAAGNHWLTVKLAATKSNRSAIGAVVRVEAGGRSLVDVVLSQSSYFSVNDPRPHFGLGRAHVADQVTVSWPSGSVDTWHDVKADQVFVATEGRTK